MTPWATTALKKRAPSTWSGTPRSWAIAATVAVYSTLSGWPIEWAWVFSIVTRPVIGSWGSVGSRNASAISAGSSVPSGRSRRARIEVPTMTAWPAASSMIMWLSDGAIVSWPRARWASWATRLPWVPGGHEQAGFLAQQVRRALLERDHGRVVAEDVVADLGVGHRPAHRVGRPGHGVGTKVDEAHRGRV